MDSLGGWLSEIRFFYMRQLAFPLSPHGQALWHWLMWRANTVYWQFPLRLSVPEIAGGTRMSQAMVREGLFSMRRLAGINLRGTGFCPA